MTLAYQLKRMVSFCQTSLTDFQYLSYRAFTKPIALEISIPRSTLVIPFRGILKKSLVRFMVTTVMRMQQL